MNLFEVFVLSGFVLLIIYSALIIYFLAGARLAFRPVCHQPSIPRISLEVIIPYKNEEEVLPSCLHSLMQLSYPLSLLRVTLVDDHSGDNSFNRVNDFIAQHRLEHIRNIRNAGNGKKAAIETAVDLTEATYVVLTDADCIHEAHWLRAIENSLASTKTDLLILPVVTHKEPGAFNYLQELDFLSLVTSTFGSRKSPFLCNGANLAFRRETFQHIRPYADNRDIPTGDDIFLLQAFRAKGRKVAFCAEPGSWVRTRLKDSLSGFMEQRVRWGSKTISYSDPFAVFVAALVFSVALFFSAGLLITMVEPQLLAPLALFFCLKTFLDSLLLYQGAVYFGKTYLLRWILPMALLYPFYIVAAAILGLIKQVRLLRPRFIPLAGQSQ